MNEESVIPEIKFEITKTKLIPRDRKLRCDCKIYIGTEVKDVEGSGILKNFNEIKRGTFVIIEDSFGNIRKARCEGKNLKDRSTYAYDTKWKYASYILEFDIDDRHCWVCTGTQHISKDLLKMMKGELVNGISKN